jgi:hypothetical protein
VKVDPKLGGQWNVPCLVAIGMFQAWWPLGRSKLGGQWKVKEKHIFTSSIFPQQTYLPPQFFPFGLTFLLCHRPKSLLTPFFPFLRSINYNYTLQRNKSLTPSLSI